MHYQSFVFICFFMLFVGCHDEQRENIYDSAALIVGESALSSGLHTSDAIQTADALHDIATSDLTHSLEFDSLSPQEIIQLYGLTSRAHLVSSQDHSCTTNVVAREQAEIEHRLGSPLQGSTQSTRVDQPYQPVLFTEETRVWPPVPVQLSSPHGLPVAPDEVVTSDSPHNLSEIRQLLESFRAVGCADDHARDQQQCLNHPYQRALTARSTNLSDLGITSLEVE